MTGGREREKERESRYNNAEGQLDVPGGVLRRTAEEKPGGGKNQERKNQGSSQGKGEEARLKLGFATQSDVRNSVQSDGEDDGVRLGP